MHLYVQFYQFFFFSSGSLSQAVWHPDLQRAEVVHQVGSYWSTMGQVENNKLYLQPEEALYLLEIVSVAFIT